jgi:Mor family transcriptional regulator
MADLFEDQDLPLGALPEHEALLQKWPSRLVEILDHLEHQLGAELRGTVAPETITRIAREAVLAIASVAGGRPIYLPAASHLRRALRDERLWEGFRGNNYDELCRTTGLTESQVRRIINTQQKVQVARRQRSLKL